MPTEKELIVARMAAVRARLLRELIVQFSDFAVARYGVNSEQARISMCLADGLDPWIEPPLLCLPSHEQ